MLCYKSLSLCFCCGQGGPGAPGLKGDSGDSGPQVKEKPGCYGDLIINIH